MSEPRVSDERLAELCKRPAWHAIAHDLRDARAERDAARERIEKLEAALRRLADEVDASNGLIAKGRAMIGPSAAELMLIDGVRLSPKQAKP